MKIPKFDNFYHIKIKNDNSKIFYFENNSLNLNKNLNLEQILS